MNVTLDHIEPIAKNIYTFWFRPSHPISYIAGQYIEMYLPHDAADERGERRWFTLSSSPSEELLAITTKHFGDPVSSFKQRLFALKPGDEVKLSEPMGDFVLPKDTTIPLVFVVGGIGVAPVRSIVKWLLDTNEKRTITLLYGAKTESEVAFREIFEAYGITPQIILSSPEVSWRGAAGYITTDMIMQAASDSRSLIYISGPEQFTEKLAADLKTVALPPERLVLDFFPGYPIS
jgi:ferredoxin-NADP reductase